MKKIFVLSLALLLTASVNAKSLRELWVEMPDSLLPILNKNLRTELVELKDMGVKSEVKNLLDEDCVMDTITSNYLQLTTSKASSLQMKLLPQASGDSLLCVVKTFSAPEKESEVRFYDQGWQELDAKACLDATVASVDAYFKAKPDTMTEERYQEMKSMIEPRMFYSELSPDENMIIFHLSTPLVFKEDKTQLQALIVQRKFNWDGRMFKKN